MLAEFSVEIPNGGSGREKTDWRFNYLITIHFIKNCHKDNFTIFAKTSWHEFGIMLVIFLKGRSKPAVRQGRKATCLWPSEIAGLLGLTQSGFSFGSWTQPNGELCGNLNGVWTRLGRSMARLGMLLYLPLPTIQTEGTSWLPNYLG